MEKGFLMKLFFSLLSQGCENSMFPYEIPAHPPEAHMVNVSV
jgi:hypothetical protein